MVCVIFLINSHVPYDCVLEHGHSHSHPPHSDKEMLTPVPNDISLAVLPNADVSGSNSSLYGHPAMTRDAIVQAANSMQQRSPVSPIEIHSTADPKSTNNVSPQALYHSTNVTNRATSLHSERAASIHNTPIQDHSPATGHSHGSMNMRGLLLHVFGDALGNIGVIVTGLVIWLTNWSGRFYLDPALSLVIAMIIFSSALPLVRSTCFILLQGVPQSINLNEVRARIREVIGVRSVHELHVWQLSEAKLVASVHVMVDRDVGFMGVAADIRKGLHDLGIHSSTIQPEYMDDHLSVVRMISASL
jgi:zinc transporter 1